MKEREQSSESEARRYRLFDAHCHLQDERVYAKARSGEIVAEARIRGVDKIAVNGCCEGEDWNRVEKLWQDFPDTIVPNFGLHPWFLHPSPSADWESRLRSMLLRNPRAGLGEVGLDKSKKVLQHTSLDVQTDLFLRQLRLAKELVRPVSVHCVKAWGRMQECLAAEGPFPAGVLLHSFVGPVEVIKGLSKQNAYFSLSLSVLKLKEQKARDVIRAIPLDRLLLETDSPDALCQPRWNGNQLRHIQNCTQSVRVLADSEMNQNSEKKKEEGSIARAPRDEEEASNAQMLQNSEEAGGKAKSFLFFNHPSNVIAVMKLVAEVTGQPEETIALHTYANACKLFLKQDALSVTRVPLEP